MIENARYLDLIADYFPADPKVQSVEALKGPGKRGHIVADTLLRTQMFPCLPARVTFVADTNFVSGTPKMCPQQMFPGLRSPRNIMGNIVSATMCPRLPGPLNKDVKLRCLR